ncbi:putative Galactose-binding domain-containing protein [Rosa chinensis]|uniref:Putative Galactose-binding domain-containing protein n=2 Tax=Rosa chinensis TaxID=74649 RepID=A0A2P6PY06_ROSCH|nr:putative Galactose-binding domain-containing protein [Rosa chinensis]
MAYSQYLPNQRTLYEVGMHITQCSSLFKSHTLHSPHLPHQREQQKPFKIRVSNISNMRGIALLLAVLLCSTCHLAMSLIDGYLENGNFELAPKPSDIRGTEVIGRYAIPKWEISGFVEYIKSGQKQGDMLLVVPEGAYAVRLGNEASIKQRIKVTKGLYYSITFSAARTCAQEERLNISVAPDSGVLPIQTVYSSNGWDSYAWAFQADFPEIELVLHNPGVEEDPACGPLIDSIAIRTLYPPRATNKNLLKNAGFEEGPYVFPNTSWGVLIPPNIEDDHSPLPGWMVESLKAVKYIDSDHFSVPEGKRAVELVAGKESAIAQVVRTIPGKTYVLTFSVGDASNSCEGSMIVEAFAGRNTVKVPYESKGKGGFKRAVLKLVAVSNRTRIMFLSTFYTMRSDDFSSLCGPVLDDVKLLSLRRPRQ